MDLTARIVGLDVAERYLRQLQAGAAYAATIQSRIGAAAPYAWGIEFGRRRSGRLARRAGGALFLTNAWRAVWPTVTPTLAVALPGGEAAVARAVARLEREVVAGAAARVPVVSGNLRRSLYTTPGGR